MFLTANKPLKPVNRVLPPATLQQRGTKRPGTAVNEVKSKISRRTPVKVTTGKNVRRSLARKSTKLVPIKKPAPYDYKARFGLLQDKHRKTVEDFKELELRYAGSEELLNKLKEDLHVCTNDLTNTKKKLEEQVKTLDSQTKLYDEIKTQNTHLQSTLDIKTQNLDAANSKIEQLQNANDELLQRSDKLSMENLDQKSRIEAYEAEMTLNIKTMEHKNKLINEFDVLRRNLMNVIQDLKGNIRVFCRIRPTLSKENYRSSFAINYIDEKSIEISRKTKQPSQFSFDQVFSESSNQEDIFTELSQLIQSVLDGYNVCVFAYGQTGSG